jgi:CelD/BcsL family acetyltransferase involved in cellulose biosynthesis
MTPSVVHRPRSFGPDRLPPALAAVGVTGAALLLATVETPVRGAFAALLLLVAPGWAVASLFRDTPWQRKVAIASAATVIVNVAVAQIMVASAWSPRGGVAAVAAVSGCLMAYGLGRSPGRSAAGPNDPVPLAPPVGADGMRVDVVRPTELGRTECEQWRAMQRRLPHLDNPFLAPEFARAVGRFRDNARVAVLWRGSDIVGFFPFDRHRLGIGRPIAAELTDCQGLVHVPGLELDAKDLLQSCGLSTFEFDHLVDGQPFFEPYTTARAASPVIDLSDGYDAYEAELRQRSPKFSRTTRSKARKLAREVGDVHFEYDVRDRDALRQLMRWKSDQYRRTGRPDRFAQPWIVALVEHMLGADDAAFAGSLSMLYAGDRPVAGHFGLRTGTVLVGWFPAYDVGFAKYSPGLIQHLRMAQAAAAAGIQVIDLGKGSREYKDSLKSRELTVAEGRVLRASPAATAYWTLRSPVLAARTFVLARPQLFGAVDRALKQYGRISSALSSRPEPASWPPPAGDDGHDSRGRDGHDGSDGRGQEAP